MSDDNYEIFSTKAELYYINGGKFKAPIEFKLYRFAAMTALIFK